MGMRDVYRKFAEKHGVSIEEVKRDMQLAIDETYKNPKNSELIKKIKDQIQCEEEKPTVEEFVLYIANMVRNDQR